LNEEREDFAAKLLLIEREAEMLLEDLPPGVMRSRAQHIVTTARLLRSRLDVAASLIITPRGKPEQT
jgi:hypothetical protein